MAVAVIGAGAAGLACARRLVEAGVECDVYERWPGLGGQAATMEVGDGLRIERYYHYLFTSDSIAIDAFEQLGLGELLRSYPSSAAFAVDGRIWPFNGVGDLLRFRPLSPASRLRMGLALLRLQLGRGGIGEYERQTASSWIRAHMGEQAWEHVWGPLMRGKFGERAEEISMGWIWDKVGKRRNLRDGEARQERFIWPTGSFEPLFAELARRIEAGGSRVLIDRPAARLLRDGDALAVVPGASDSFRRGLDPRRFDADGPPIPYEAIVCCVPNDVFAELLDPGLAAEVGDEYLARLREIEYFTALNLVLELERPLTEHFWVNIADRRYPVRRPDRALELRGHREHRRPGVLARDQLPARRPRAARARRRRAARPLPRRAPHAQPLVRALLGPGELALPRAGRPADRQGRLPRADPAPAHPGRRPAARQHDPDLPPGPRDQLRDPRRRASRGGGRRGAGLLMAGEGVALAERSLAAYNRWEVEPVLELLHDEVEWRPAIPRLLGGESTVYRGHDAVRGMFGEIRDAFGEIEIEFSEIRISATGCSPSAACASAAR